MKGDVGTRDKRYVEMTSNLPLLVAVMVTNVGAFKPKALEDSTRKLIGCSQRGIL